MGRQDDFRHLKSLLADREWRLDNLYWIQDAAGQEVKFQRNTAQRALWEHIWHLNVILKARQLGISTFVALVMLDACLFNSNTACGIIDSTLSDAEKKLAKVRFAYENLPAALKRAVPVAKENAYTMAFSNGSSIGVGTSHRGGTLQFLHVSELGTISAERPDRAEEIRTGAFGTVHSGQSIFVESTAKGTGGAFHDLVQSARNRNERNSELTPLDFKLHFFPWWAYPGYALRASFTLPVEMKQYFEELEAEHDIHLSNDQKAWYAKKLEQFGGNRELVFREYPSTVDEAFFVSLEGAYFRRQMTRMRADGRIGTNLYDPSKPVNTFWDIGVNDETAIWFHQTDGVRHRLIDYYENDGEGVAHYAAMLRQKAEQRGFHYNKHYGPHDLEGRDWANDAVKRRAVAKEHGIDFIVVPRVKAKGDSIEAGRNFLQMTWIDEEYCDRGIQCLDNYTKEWDERRGTWRDTPLKNWAAHGADALQCGAMGLKDDLPREDRPARRRAGPRQSAWVS